MIDYCYLCSSNKRSLSHLHTELRVVVVGAWSRETSLGFDVFERAAEDAAAAVFVFGVGVGSEFV